MFDVYTLSVVVVIAVVVVVVVALGRRENRVSGDVSQGDKPVRGQ